MNMFPVRRASSLLCILALAAAWPAARAADDASGGPDIVAAGRHKPDFAKRLAKAKVGPDDEIVLVVHSAQDCRFCQRWKGSLGGRSDIEQYAGSHARVHYYVVERLAIAGMEDRNLYPEQVAWLFDKRAGKGKTNMAVPSYDVIVHRKVVWHAYGYNAWAKTVFPAIQDLDRRRKVAGAD